MANPSAGGVEKDGVILLLFIGGSGRFALDAWLPRK